MRRLILALSVLFLIRAAGIAEQICIVRIYDKMGSRAEEVKCAVEADVRTALPAAKSLQEEWLGKRSFLEAVTPHNETKEMVLRIAELIGYIEAKDDKSATATAAIIVEMCENTPHILGFHWQHIF